MTVEYEKNLREFGLENPPNPSEERIIEVLRQPTRDVAGLFRRLGPDFWYGEVFNGNYYSEEFKNEYQRRAELNPQIDDPYTYLDSNWDPRPITDKRNVRKIIEKISSGLLIASDLIDSTEGKDKSKLLFAEYLSDYAGLLLFGDFKGAIKHCVEQDQSYPIGWGAVLAETYNDPMKIRPVPEGWLTYKDKKSTDRATGMISRLRDASFLLSNKIGYSVVPRRAQVVVANVLMLSGRLAEVSAETSAFREPSGFSQPNDPALTPETLIYLFNGRIANKNQKLSQKLQTHLGIYSEPVDLMTLVIGHEYAHGYHESKEELQKYGFLNQIMRELMANDLAATLVGSGTFSYDLQRKFIRGLLAYSVDDVNKWVTVIRDPKITSNVDINLLMEEIGDYGLVGLTTLREARESNAIKLNDGKPATIDHQKLFEQAKNRFLEESYLAREGNPDKTEIFLKKHLYGLRLFPVAKPQSLAS